METLITLFGTLIVTLGISGIGYCFYKIIPDSVVEKISDKLL